MARASKIQMEERYQAVLTFCEEQQPCTVRGVYYNLTTQGVVPKEDAGYKKIALACKDLRLSERLPWEYIVDNTRWMRKPRTFSSIESALEDTATTYRRDFLSAQGLDIEIWLEKDALAGVVYPVTEEWDVPLMVVKGYPSLSFMHSAAQDMHKATKQGKTNHIFYFGDHDPSGKDIFRCVGETLREFAPAADINMKQVAVTEQQIADWDLPSRATKRTDSRSKNFTGDSVELDAIPPAQLRQLVQDSIFSIMDIAEMEKIIDVEKAEQESISQLISGFSKSGLAPF